MKYRADIDGLRAIAVLSVVFYHADFRLIAGGFVGVDVFFVISGYLIAATLYASASRPDYSLGGYIRHFYARRVRRIGPAYVLFSLLAAVGAYFLFLPPDFQEFGRSLVWSTLTAANIYFYFTADYFGQAADKVPLLHYWSLGVEEQFYILFPLLLAAVRKVSKSTLALLFSGLLVASLVAAEFMIRRNPSAAFYLLPFRAWELLAGAILALGVAPKPNKAFAVIAGLAGLALVGWPIFAYTDQTPFPGWTALPPVLGSLLIIWAGSIGNPVASALSLGPVRYIGLISYSLYLAHWPVIVFAKQIFWNADPTLFGWSVVGAALALAMLSYHFIERPTRFGKWWTTPHVVILTATTAAACVAIAAIAILTNGLPSRLPSEANRILAYRFDRTAQFREKTCFLQPQQKFEELDPSCFNVSGKKVVLWGDSHAAHYAAPLSEALAKNGYGLVQMSASLCPPVVKIDAPARPNCRPFNEWVLQWILDNRPAAVLMGAFWRVDPPFLAEMQAQLAKLDEAKIPVIVIGRMPFYRDSAQNLLAKRIMLGNPSKLADADADTGTPELFETKIGHVAGPHYLSAVETICGQRTACVMGDERGPFLFDRGHVTDIGAQYYVSKLAPAILSRLAADKPAP